MDKPITTEKCLHCGATYPANDGSRPDYIHSCPDQIVDTPEVTDPQGNITKPATFKPTPKPEPQS